MSRSTAARWPASPRDQLYPRQRLGRSGAHVISPGGDGSSGTLAVGSLNLNSNSTLRFTTSLNQIQIINSGGLNFNGAGAAVIQVSGELPGTYPLVTSYGIDGVVPSDFTLDLLNGSPAPSTYSLNDTGSELDLVVIASLQTSKLALSTTGVSIRTMQNQAGTASVNLNEIGGKMDAGFSATPGAAVTVVPTSGTVSKGGSQALTIGLADYTTLGGVSDTVAVSNLSNGSDPFNSNGTNIIHVSGAVLQDRVVTASSITGGMHVGVGVNPATANFTLSTTGDDNSNTRVTVGNVSTPDNNKFIVTGGANTVFNSATSTDTRSLTATIPLPLGGVYSGSITLPVSGENLPGESDIPVSVPYSVMVFSGNANWTNAGGDSAWGNDANWSDALSSATLGAPGLSGAVSINDQANLLGPGGTISLNNSSPHVAAVNFSSTAAYTIAQGSGNGALHLNAGGTIQVSATSNAWNVVNVPVVLDGTTASFVNNGSNNPPINFYGPVSGSAGATVLTLAGSNNTGWAFDTIGGNISNGAATALAIVKDGPGVWELAGTNSYTGGTTVKNGTLFLNGAGTFSGGITVDSGALLHVVASDANLGAAGNAITLNGGSIAFYASFVTNAARGFVIGDGGAAINTDTFVGTGSTIGGNITNADPSAGAY